LSVAVPEEQTMLSQAEKAVKIALKIGAAEAEAFVYEGKATSVGIERGQITKSNRIIDKGIGIRVQIQKAIGFAYTNMTEKLNSVEETAQKALIAAQASKPDNDWKGLPEKHLYSTPEKTFDKKILDLHPSDLVNLTSRMLEAANESDKRILSIEGGAGVGYVSNAIANSNGIFTYEQGTIIECSLATVANEGNTVTPVCFEFNAERTYNVNPEWVGKEAAKLSVSALKTKRVETKNYTLILTQFALQDLLQYTLINAVKADNVERNQSAFKDKLDTNVASENLTVYDDGLLPGGLRTGIFDAEGVPHRKTLIIEKGVLRNFLFDSYTANIQGKLSTGNASRAGYLSTPNIEATNFHIIPGNRSTQDLIQEVSDGLLVFYLQGAHSSNPVSGEFSVVAAPAWKINKGEIEHATKGVMLAGNIFELLKKVSGIGNNERKMGQLVAPWITIDNVKVIGK
jgi:PmbA protein